LRLMLQLLMPSTGNTPLPPSAINKAGLIPIAFTLFGLITYGLLAIVFVLIQEVLPGKRMTKGLVFGLLFGMMWAVYLFEPLPFSAGASLVDTFSYPIVDGMTIAILGLLLGRFIGTDSSSDGKVALNISTLTLLAIPVFFMAGRFLGYTVIQIYSFFTDRPIGTMLWAAETGIWIGVMYLLLRPGIATKSLLAKAAFFGIVVFGIDLLMFNFFIPIVFETDIVDLLARTAIDIISVTAGVYICEKIYSYFGMGAKPALGGTKSQ
ncbi:MAG TPA: hypothetical protein VGK13_04815, partial [Methanocellaceae archaeon]